MGEISSIYGTDKILFKAGSRKGRTRKSIERQIEDIKRSKKRKRSKKILQIRSHNGQIKSLKKKLGFDTKSIDRAQKVIGWDEDKIKEWIEEFVPKYKNSK